MINEIRIGSWLFGSGGIKRQVTIDVLQKAVESVNAKISMPIPLKEETLMKVTPMVPFPNDEVVFDFKNGPWTLRLYKENFYWSVRLAFLPGTLSDVVFYPTLKNIEYVHQLQNLVQDLFGIELLLEP